MFIKGKTLEKWKQTLENCGKCLFLSFIFYFWNDFNSEVAAMCVKLLDFIHLYFKNTLNVFLALYIQYFWCWWIFLYWIRTVENLLTVQVINEYTLKLVLTYHYHYHYPFRYHWWHFNQFLIFISTKTLILNCYSFWVLL